ncbi:sigma-70 family RNA polymerase sigma factor [Anaerohalosphaera lusitana]|nr:sigma-70 family RNA polymerase sigma factor [Anaerohalosphaera lusitana]
MSKADRFVRLLATHHGRIYAYIFTLVPNWSDADDLMQEVTAIMLRKFDDFEPGTNFVAWATSIARYEVLRLKRDKKRSSALSLDAVGQISAEMELQNNDTELRLDALKNCLSKLNEKDRRLILLKYQSDQTTRNVASTLGISIYAVYRAVDRIHSVLLRCVRRTVRQVGGVANG